MAFMGSINMKWKELASVRSRSVDTKTMARAHGKLRRSDTLASSSNSENYADGSKALRFDEENNGFAFYKSGKIAVVVTKVNEYAKKFFFYNDGAKESELLCFVSEVAEGFALEAPETVDEPTKRLLWDNDRATFVEMRPKETVVLAKWRWDPQALGAGTRPTETIRLRINDCLRCEFSSRDRILVVFECDGIRKEFDCGLKVKRSSGGTYLDKGNCVVNSLGKVVPKLDPVKFPGIQERQRLALEKMKSLNAQIKPSSSSVQNKAIGDVMAGLESFFKTYEDRVASGDCVVSAAPDASWREDALKMTKSEIPVVAPTGQEINDPETERDMALSLVGEATRRGKRWVRADGTYMNNLDIHRTLVKKNAVLHRPSVLCGASGRYSRQAKVQGPNADFKKLKQLTSTTFDRYLNKEALPTQLTLLACLRGDDSICRRAEQLLEKVNGQLARSSDESVTGEDEKNSDDTPYKLCKFEMSESNFLKRRYNIQTVPMYLMFYGSKLVYGGTLGGGRIHMSMREKQPPMLLLENVVKDQMSIESTMRGLACEWDLTMDISGLHRHIETRRNGSGYSVAFISSALSPSEIKSAMTAVSGARARRGKPVLIAIVHKCGTVPFSKKVLFSEKGASTSRRRGAGPTSTPRACLKTRIIRNADDKLLRGAHVALQKPLTAASVKACLAMWERGESSHHASLLDESACIGLSTENVLREMKKGLVNGRENKFLDPKSDFGIVLVSK